MIQNEKYSKDSIWPDCFVTGRVTQLNTAEIVSDGLGGWALCMAGAEIPKNFGEGMAQIGQILRIAPTPENLMELSKKYTEGK